MFYTYQINIMIQTKEIEIDAIVYLIPRQCKSVQLPNVNLRVSANCTYVTIGIVALI